MEITLLLEYSERSQLRAWLNMDRYKDLEDRGLMTPAGRRALWCRMQP